MIESEEAIVAIPIIESLEPKRAMLRTIRELPKMVEPRTDKDDPSLATP